MNRLLPGIDAPLNEISQWWSDNLSGVKDISWWFRSSDSSFVERRCEEVVSLTERLPSPAWEVSTKRNKISNLIKHRRKNNDSSPRIFVSCPTKHFVDGRWTMTFDASKVFTWKRLPEIFFPSNKISMIYVPISVGVQSTRRPAELRSVDGDNRWFEGVTIDTWKSDEPPPRSVSIVNHVGLLIEINERSELCNRMSSEDMTWHSLGKP